MILVVGATGQLGTAVVREVLARGSPVRVMVRRPEAASRFESVGCEAYLGDMTRLGDAKVPFPNVTTVIATANSAVPARVGDSSGAVERVGIEVSSRGSFVPLFRAKREIEERLENSSLGHTIFRFPACLDTRVPMMGLGRVAAGLESAAAGRDFEFARSHFKEIRDSVERDGVSQIAGDGRNALAAIAVEVCARLMAGAVNRPECLNRALEITGPRAVASEEIAQEAERILGCALKRKKTPAWVFSTLAFASRIGNPAAANLMALDRLAATVSTPVVGQERAPEVGVQLKPPERWLLERLSAL